MHIALAPDKNISEDGGRINANKRFCNQLVVQLCDGLMLSHGLGLCFHSHSLVRVGPQRSYLFDEFAEHTGDLSVFVDRQRLEFHPLGLEDKLF